MAKTRQQKKEILEKITEKIKKAISVVFIGYEKVKIKDQERLRKKLKKEGGEFYVTKKKLLELALKNLKFEDLKNFKLEKEVALVLGYNDETMPAKVVVDFSKENENIKIKGGIFEKKFIDVEKVKFLSNIPSKKVLQTKILLSLQNPLISLIQVLQGNLRNLIYIFNTLSKKLNNK
ncbi:MAG: 50S ribosomal protein L10 [Patescibacteria group bacterium]